MKQILSLLFILLFISACSTADTTGDITTRNATTDIVNKGSGNIYMFFPISVTASTTTDTDIETDNDPANRTDPALALSSAGGLATLAKDEAKNLLDDVSGRFFQKQETDNSNKDSNNPQTTNTKEVTPVPVVIKDEEKENIEPNETVTKEYNSSETYSLKKSHGKMFTWLEQSGESYSSTSNKSIKFVWEGCTDFTVANAYNTTTRDGSSNQAQAYYFSGMSQRDHRTPEGHKDYNDASIFSDPSCNAPKVTIFYNK